MNHPTHVAMVRRLLEQLDGKRPPGPRTGEVPAAHYTSAERWEQERLAVFRRTPLLVALERDVEGPGTCLVVDAGGVPLLLVRDAGGTLRAFRNACRHRGTELLPAAGGAACSRKALVCRYHGWTYDLAGALVHVPHREAFDGREAERDALTPAGVAVRHGFVWASAAPFDLDRFLGPIDAELAWLGVPDLAVYRRVEREVRGNWKLVVDAFLDGYHIRQLHRETIHRFFLDACAEAEPAGAHIRAVTARRALEERRGEDLAGLDLRQVATPSYLVYPNVVLIAHPDYLSVLVLTPLAEDRTRFAHTMLVPRDRLGEADAEHWARSFGLIDDGVFAGEDLAVVEAMQRGLAAGADHSVLFGRAEHPALWFHERLTSDVEQGW